jgi:ABC-type lipoprotein release transport system permease subunit
VAAPGGNQFIPIDLSRLSEPVIIPSNLMLAGIALAALICMGAGLYPALWAARLPPVVALKQE